MRQIIFYRLVCISVFIHLHTLNVDELTLLRIALGVELIPQISNLLSQSRIKIELDRKLRDPEPTGTERVRQMTSKLLIKPTNAIPCNLEVRDRGWMDGSFQT